MSETSASSHVDLLEALASLDRGALDVMNARRAHDLSSTALQSAEIEVRRAQLALDQAREVEARARAELDTTVLRQEKQFNGAASRFNLDPERLKQAIDLRLALLAQSAPAAVPPASETAASEAPAASAAPTPEQATPEQATQEQATQEQATQEQATQEQAGIEAAAGGDAAASPIPVPEPASAPATDVMAEAQVETAPDSGSGSAVPADAPVPAEAVFQQEPAADQAPRPVFNPLKPPEPPRRNAGPGLGMSRSGAFDGLKTFDERRMTGSQTAR